MLRRLHSLPGLVIAAMLVVAATSGAVLSIDPVAERLANPVASGTSVADLAQAVAGRHQVVDRISVRPSGAVTASYTDGEDSGVERVDPATGASLGAFEVSGFTRFVTNLHRSFLLGDAGRAGSAIAAFGMLVLTLSGAGLLARRLGGWRAALRPIRGDAAQRWHAELSRFAVLGLLLTSLTGVWMSAETFGLVPETAPSQPIYSASGGAPSPVRSLAALACIDVSELRELTFPEIDDPRDVFKLRTAQGEAIIDQATGAMLAFTPSTILERVQETVRMLHTGRGASLLAILLGVSAACVPALGATGIAIWLRRRLRDPHKQRGVARRFRRYDHPRRQ